MDSRSVLNNHDRVCQSTSGKREGRLTSGQTGRKIFSTEDHTTTASVGAVVSPRACGCDVIFGRKILRPVCSDVRQPSRLFEVFWQTRTLGDVNNRLYAVERWMQRTALFVEAVRSFFTAAP